MLTARGDDLWRSEFDMAGRKGTSAEAEKFYRPGMSGGASGGRGEGGQ